MSGDGGKKEGAVRIQKNLNSSSKRHKILSRRRHTHQ